MEVNKNDLMYFTDEDGVKKHICASFSQKVYKASSISELVKLYKKEPSWALSVKYPSLDIMKKYFDTPEVMRNGVYVDRDVDMMCDDEVYIFNKCRGRITLTFNPDKACFPVIYIGLDSDLEIVVDGIYSEINVYDNAKVYVRSKGRGKAKIYKYGDSDITMANNIYLTLTDKR